MKQVEWEMNEWSIKNKRRKKYVYCRESWVWIIRLLGRTKGEYYDLRISYLYKL